MKTLAAAALLVLSFCATVSGDEDTETAVTAQPGDVALLPCYTAGNVTPSLTTWIKDGREIVRGGGDSTPSPSAGTQRLAVLQDGRLNITQVVRGDEGIYLCTILLPGNNIYHGRVQLQVTSGPENVSLSITTATPLSNGTLIVFRGSTVSFNCSASSYPSQHLTWGFSGASPPNDTLLTGLGPWLEYRIENVQPGAQGVYSCTAHNTVSNQTVKKSTELLVYYAPDRHPECMWTPAQDPSHIYFNCTWFGAYPTPTLRWGENHDQQQWHEGHLYATEETDRLSMILNRTLLSDGQTLTCIGQHLARVPGHENSCSFTLKPPFPEGEPIATAVERDSITLTCSENISVPPASTTWRKGLQQEVIIPGPKYILSEEGPVLTLTIVNVSKEDEGFYFCRSENPLNVTELEVYLTVKTSSTYTGVIIGVFIAALIVGSTIIIAKTVYNNRHRICLGGGFGQMEDTGDVLDLVESDDEQIFHDTVPRLPPLPNGNHTTLVQIHRIPSNEYEDSESVDTSAQQEDTVQTDEPEELVTF